MSEKFSRYKDNKGRLFIVLARWLKVEYEGKIPVITPTTVDLLNVEKEELIIKTAAEFENYVQTGLLKRIR